MEQAQRILVAEDSALLRRMIGDVLREHGWTVLEAGDGPRGAGAGAHRGPVACC